MVKRHHFFRTDRAGGTSQVTDVLWDQNGNSVGFIYTPALGYTGPASEVIRLEKPGSGGREYHEIYAVKAWQGVKKLYNKHGNEIGEMFEEGNAKIMKVGDIEFIITG